METISENNEHLIVVIDANVLIAAFLKDSITRKLLLHPHIKSFTTDFNREEFFYYKPRICKKGSYSDKTFEQMTDLLFPKIKIVPYSIYKEAVFEAETIMGKVDQKDVPLVALALTIKNDGIWTYDNHFDTIKSRIKIWNTKDLARYMF